MCCAFVCVCVCVCVQCVCVQCVCVCAVHNMAVVCSSLISCFPGTLLRYCLSMLIIIIIVSFLLAIRIVRKSTTFPSNA